LCIAGAKSNEASRNDPPRRHIENPITGERVTFLKTANDTSGEVVVIDTTVALGDFVAAEHLYP
jgi:hypothetical protein